MSTKLLLEYSDFFTLALALTVVLVMWRRGLLRKYSLVAGFLATDILSQSIQIPIFFFRRALGINRDLAYNIVFYSHFFIFAIQTILLIAITYSIFVEAMRPLVGLHDIGKVVFRWVAGISFVVAGAFAFGPHLLLHGVSASLQFANVESHLEQGVSVLTLCLLLFVSVAIKPLGLTLRSHVFGVTLGLGIFATVQLVEAAWLSTSQAWSVYSPVYLFATVGCILSYLVWGLYFTVPEPERGMVLLPTTSPYFRWNRISEALGDEPGDVVIAGFRPSMLHPAELQMFTAPAKVPDLPELQPESSPSPDLADPSAVAALEAAFESGLGRLKTATR